MAIRKVTHPNPKLSQDEALVSLQEHPAFVPGTKIKSLKKVKGHWVATLDFPTKKADGPPFLDDAADDAPSDEAPPKEDEKEEKPSDDADEDLEDALEDEKSDDEDSDDDKPESVEDAVEQLTKLVHQIADAVGVKPGPEDGPEDGPLGPHGDGPDGPPVKPPVDGPPAGPPKPPGAGPAGPGAPKAKPPLRPGMAPPGTTPVGAPSFASVAASKGVADLVVSNETDEPLKVCAAAIEAEYGEGGFKVKRLIETTSENGEHFLVKAKISRR